MAKIEAGTIIAGKYHIERQLSQGGMGSLWVARQLQLQRLVAIKLMEPTLASTVEGRIRFEREAQAAALIQSPHVVQIHDYGVEHDTPYIVMELLSGEDFGRRLKHQRRIPLPALARIFSQITKALRKAHEAGMIHLDLKPANIFLARDDEDEIVKVLDFGIAKMIDRGNATEATGTGVVLGSVHYMSPEQARGRRGLDHRSDLWSLGVIAFRAITGELPFGGSQIGDVLVKVCADPIPRASAICPDVSPEIDAFLLRALDRDPDARFQSARELAAALALLAWPGEARAPQPSLVSEIAPAPRLGRGPAVVIAPAALAPLASTMKLPHEGAPIAAPPWSAPIEAGTLTGSPRVSDLPTQTQGSAPTLAWKSAALVVFGLVAVIAAGLIGWRTLAGRHAPTTVTSAEIPVAAAEPPPSPSNPPASAREVEVEVAPEVTAAPTRAPAATTTPLAAATPLAPPSAGAPGKVGKALPPQPPPTPKKPNPALGF